LVLGWELSQQQAEAQVGAVLRVFLEDPADRGHEGVIKWVEATLVELRLLDVVCQELGSDHTERLLQKLESVRVDSFAGHAGQLLSQPDRVGDVLLEEEDVGTQGVLLECAADRATMGVRLEHLSELGPFVRAKGTPERRPATKRLHHSP
jgi:hypothetical protein